MKTPMSPIPGLNRFNYLVFLTVHGRTKFDEEQELLEAILYEATARLSETRPRAFRKLHTALAQERRLPIASVRLLRSIALENIVPSLSAESQANLERTLRVEGRPLDGDPRSLGRQT